MEADRDLLVYLNSFHTPWLDLVMFYMSQTLFWLPLYVFLLAWAIRDFRKDAMFVTVGIVLTILLADQITASVMKPWFARLRPSQEPALEGIVHLVQGFHGQIYKGGTYGFASSHAANTFGIATFFTLIWRTKYKWVLWLFVWAALMTYTRIYLGVHYPGDILVGGIVGVLAGITGFRLFKWLQKKFGKPAPVS